MLYLNDAILEEKSFPDGTPMIKLDPVALYDNLNLMLGKNCIMWKYDHDGELFRLACIANHLKEWKLTLYMPYIPNARQDRVKNREDVFTLKTFAECINSMPFQSVAGLDTHSSVAPALINNFCEEDPLYYIIKAYEMCSEAPILFYPDSGAAKRYSDMMKMPYAYGIKNRDWQTGEIKSLTVADNGIDLKDRTVLIVDDICSRGGTFIHSAKKLKELGAAKIYLYVTHCENTILEGDLLKDDLIEHVFTTDSIFRKSHEKIEVFQI